jgi:FkbM family methyltransferase
MEPSSDLIFDVGLHKAEDTALYLAKGFRVVAVEANADLCKQARGRFASEVDSGQLTIVHAAVAPQAGPVKFFGNALTEWGTTVPSWAERNATQFDSPVTETYEVPGIMFRTLLETYGTPHYLKVDIEGADLLCLEALRGWSTSPRFVSIESEKRSWPALVKEFDLLSELGYQRFKVVNQETVPRQVPPNPAREGKYVDATLARGSSGLFGEELPGRWLDRRQALSRYARIFLRYRLYGDFGVLSSFPGLGRIPAHALSLMFGEVGWYDTHARR